jgi:hypothetical protein
MEPYLGCGVMAISLIMAKGHSIRMTDEQKQKTKLLIHSSNGRNTSIIAVRPTKAIELIKAQSTKNLAIENYVKEYKDFDRNQRDQQIESIQKRQDN